MEIASIFSNSTEENFSESLSSENVSGIALVESEAKYNNRAAQRMVKCAVNLQGNIQALSAERCDANKLLHQAVDENAHGVVSFLIEHGVDINSTDSNGKTPLIVSIEKGYNSIADLLIAKKANLEITRKSDGVKALEIAISMKNESMAVQLVDAGADVNASALNNSNLLAQAICNRMFNLSRLLMEKGAKIDVGLTPESNPLYLSFLSSEPQRNELVKLLLAKGANPNYLLANQSTVFLLITEKSTNNAQDLQIIRLLCNSKGDLYAKNGSGQSPLTIAMQSNKGPILQILNEFRTDLPYVNEQLNLAVKSKDRAAVLKWIAKKADINNRDLDKHTNLYRMIMLGDHDFAQFLIANGAGIEKQELPTISDMIQKQIFTGPTLINMVDFYLRNGYSPNEADQFGRLPIFTSVMVGNLDLVNLLINHKVHVEPPTKIEGMTPLMMAIHFKKEAIANALIEAGANINFVNADTKISILALSLHEQLYSLAETLLNRGGQPNVGDNNSNTPLAIAERQGNLGFVKKLILKGADVNRNLGQTNILCEAVSHGNYEIIKCLLESGANPNPTIKPAPMSIAIKSGRQDLVELLLTHGANHERIVP